jgi:hypothetical protein
MFSSMVVTRFQLRGHMAALQTPYGDRRQLFYLAAPGRRLPQMFSITYAAERLTKRGDPSKTTRGACAQIE